MHDTQLVRRSPSAPLQWELPVPTTQTLSLVSCECGTKETDNVIQCHMCHGWQHAQCYAYGGPGDTRLPTEHRCYTCVLGSDSGEHLGQAKKLARSRQLIHCIQVRGLKATSQIAKAMGKVSQG